MNWFLRSLYMQKTSNDFVKLSFMPGHGTCLVTVRNLAGDVVTSPLPRAGEWSVLKLKQELAPLTDCPVRQQVSLEAKSCLLEKETSWKPISFEEK